MIICLLFIIPIFTATILRSAIVHIFELGKSKTHIKKATKEISLFDRMLLFGYVEHCKHYTCQARNLRYIYWLYLLFQLFSVALWLFSFLVSSWLTILQYVLIFRALILDFPIWALFFIMTKHGKNGGVTWKWEV